MTNVFLDFIKMTGHSSLLTSEKSKAATLPGPIVRNICVSIGQHEQIPDMTNKCKVTP